MRPGVVVVLDILSQKCATGERSSKQKTDHLEHAHDEVVPSILKASIVAARSPADKKCKCL